MKKKELVVMSESGKNVRQYDEETRVQAVKLAKEIGAKEVSVQLNSPYGTLRNC